MLRLHLLRHAKTELTSSTGKDFDRKLRPKGKLQTKDLGDFFKTAGNIDHVSCSSAVRTRQTVGALLDSGIPNPTYTDALYLCTYQTMLKLLWESDYEGDVLIVGHNFGISDLASYFTDEAVELRTAEYIRISFDTDSWIETSRGTGTIEKKYRPEVKDF